jgi:hypothetical protein
VGDRDALAPRLARQVGELRKLVVELGLRLRHLAVCQGDAIEHAHDALGHRTQVVQYGRPKRDRAQGLAPTLVVACTIVLEYQIAAPRHQERMRAPNAAIALQLRQPHRQVAVSRRSALNASHHEGCSHAEN